MYQCLSYIDLRGYVFLSTRDLQNFELRATEIEISIEFNSKAINHCGRGFWSIRSYEFVSISKLHVLTSYVPHKLFFVLLRDLQH